MTDTNNGDFPPSPLRGGWGRFDKYEIKEGFIQPTSRAVARGFRRYDPYKEIESVELGERLALGLVDLEQSLESKEGLDGFSKRDERQILGWCDRFGLLGLLTHQVDSVTLHAQKLPVQFEPIKMVRAGTWFRQSVHNEDRSTGTFSRSLESVAAQGELYCETAWKPLSDFWARFFIGVPPGAAETHRYPLPYDDEFWQSYREPLTDFLDSVRLIAECAKWLAMNKPPPGESPEYLVRMRYHAGEALSLIADPVRMRLAQEDDDWQPVFESSSLLGEIAVLLAEDASQKRLRMCEVCRKLIAAGAYQTLYCSKTCSANARTRRARAKNLDMEAALLQRASTGLVPTGKDWGRVERLFERGLLRRADGNSHERFILSRRGERRLAKIGTTVE